MRRDNLVYRLLYRHISRWQMLGFALANLCGMTIIVAAIQFATDVIPMFTGSDSFMRPGQIVVTKQVGALSTLMGASPAFSDAEIKDLQEQPFTRGVGLFLPSQYRVYATVGSKQMGMEFSTEMFFESLPDDFIDVDLSQWHVSATADTIPIILPRNYLNLYNFGYAASQGLPAISESLVKQVGIRLLLVGHGVTRQCQGKVVAFSKSINTILVPQNFMEAANRQLAPGRSPQPSRIVIAADNAADDALADYLDRHGYDTEGTDIDSAKTASFLRLTTTVVIAVGLVICVLSFYVLLLSIFLLLQKHTAIIDNLLLIGYSPGGVARPFHVLAFTLNTFVLVASVWLSVVLRGIYLPRLGLLYPQFSPSHHLPAVVTAMALYGLMCVLNHVAIRRKVLGIWTIHES